MALGLRRVFRCAMRGHNAKTPRQKGFANEGCTNLTDDWMATGKADSQTVDRDWNIIGQPRIEGVAVWHRVFGHERPLLVVAPPGVWHGLKALGATPSLTLNLVDRAYSYETPDHWRLPPDTPEIPFSLL
jgi:hypothetical protein